MTTTLEPAEAQAPQEAKQPVPLSPLLVRLAIAPLLLAAFTSTMAILNLAGPVSFGDFFVGLSLLTLLPLVIIGRRGFTIPAWMFIPAVVIPICVLVRQIDPPPYFWRVLRLQVQQYHPESFGKAMLWLAAIYIVPIAVIAASRIEPRVVEWVMGAYAAGVTVSCVVAFTDLIGLTHVRTELDYAAITYSWSDRRFSGLSDHPNNLGYTILISLPFLIYFLSKMRQKWIPGLALVIMVCGLLATGSRSAQGLAPLCVLAAAMCLPNRRAALRVVATAFVGMVGVGAVLLFTVLADKQADILRFTGEGAGGAERANEARLTLFQQALNDWMTYPIFGAGIRHVTEAHNITLQLLAAGGIVLAAGMIAYFAFVFRDCWRLIKGGNYYARFLFISIATWLIAGQAGTYLTGPEMYYTVGCVAALTVATVLRPVDDDAELTAVRT
ncbi:O-antigen ligase family protein [Mycolicibacterium wolinskyi]|uniref:O-antigen ligase family protein n=1 Tax=Mycolicibacterium wolinskyi TaxID=59750 RepID=UPI003917B461